MISVYIYVAVVGTASIITIAKTLGLEQTLNLIIALGVVATVIGVMP